MVSVIDQKPIGFVAGTLVHARCGLKPIEQIEVGDWVLSRPQNGEKRTEYKRVMNTIRFGDREVFAVSSYCKASPFELDTVVGTDNQPFWVKGTDPALLRQIERAGESDPWAGQHGWKRLDLLEGAEVLSLADGSDAFLYWEARQVLATGDAERGFVLNSDDAADGEVIDFANRGVRYLHAHFVPLRDLDPEFASPAYRTTVYTIEVEDFRTYFVGRFGVWVHNMAGSMAREESRGDAPANRSFDADTHRQGAASRAGEHMSRRALPVRAGQLRR